MTEPPYLLSTLETRARTLADLTGSSFVTSTEALALLNSSLQDLYDITIDAGEDYVGQQASSQISIVSGTEKYSLPTDFYKLLKVFLVEEGERIPMERFLLNDMGPSPTSSGTTDMWYVPLLTPLASSGALPAWVQYGWEEYIIMGAAIAMRQKAEEDCSTLMSMLAKKEANIRASLTSRDQGNADRMRDVRSLPGRLRYPYPFSYQTNRNLQYRIVGQYIYFNHNTQRFNNPARY